MFSPLQWLRAGLIRAAFAEPVPLEGRRVVVTGASPGSLGFEAARELVGWGATVTLTARNQPEVAASMLRDALGDSSAGDRVHAHALDLSEADSVRGFSDWVAREHRGGVDVLLNNAGIHLDLMSRWREPKLSEDGIELHWRTNFLGTSQLTHALLPLLKRAGQQGGDARVVNVVSMLHARGVNAELFETTRPYNSWEAYSQSKLALVHLTRELQRRFAQTHGVQAYCLHPGSVFTNVAGKGLAGTGLIETVRNAFAPIEAFFLKTPLEGVQTHLHCATSPGLRGGGYYRECASALASPEADDAAVGARLYDETEAWVSRL